MVHVHAVFSSPVLSWYSFSCSILLQVPEAWVIGVPVPKYHQNPALCRNQRPWWLLKSRPPQKRKVSPGHRRLFISSGNILLDFRNVRDPDSRVRLHRISAVGPLVNCNTPYQVETSKGQGFFGFWSGLKSRSYRFCTLAARSWGQRKSIQEIVGTVLVNGA